ncbi:MAG: Translation factor pelota [Chrysothrix sp. TS-e1954]|nr:MAG: Translation factor pelota [Chrysothrix sp. TS-e1954]
MKLVKSHIDRRRGVGNATLLPQEPEDMWHLYQLIRTGDVLRAPAVRKVTEKAATGSTNTKTVRTSFSIRVKGLDFDPGAGQLHVAGVICASNPYASLGSHHTLDLELQRQLTLQKGDIESNDTGGGWDSVALDMLREATDVRQNVETFAVVMAEGLANICIITEFQTVVRAKVESNVPRKRQGHGADAHDRGMDRFYETVLQTLLRQIDLPALQAEGKNAPPLLLASPGFLAQAFLKYMLASAVRSGDKMLNTYAKDSTVIAHTSSGHVHSLNEALKAPAVLSKLSETKFAKDSRLMERFFELIRQDDGRAWYGPNEVRKAVDKGAVGRGGGVLLISNKLFRSQDVATRKKWVALVERVKHVEGGEVRVMSSSHESGKRLESLGDIGAILTFALQDLDEDES